MNKLEETILQDFGLDQLSPQAQRVALNNIYTTIELRVGMKLADQMTEEQLATFEKLKDDEDQTEFLKWVEQTFPDYPKLVAAELQALKDEVKTTSSQILEAHSKNDDSDS